MKKNAMSLTIITVISAVTVTILCFGAISKANADFNIQSSSPQDINFTKVKMAQQFEHQLNQHGIPYTKKRMKMPIPILLKMMSLKVKRVTQCKMKVYRLWLILISKVITLQLQIYKVHFQ